MAALLIGTLSAYLLHQSQSATSIITVVIAVAAAIFAYVLQQLAPAPRKFVLVSGIALGILGLLFALQLGAFEAVTGAFGKDATLTGRSYLWAEGMAAFGEDPILGMGYQAYWVHGFPDAERLWDEFYITARTGFHFHNTYIETLVELGVVGLILFVILFAGAAVGFLVRLLEGDRDVSAQLMFGLMAMLLVRSIVEVDLITPYVVGSFLLYYAAGTAHRSVLRTHGEIQPLGRDYRAPPAYRT